MVPGNARTYAGSMTLITSDANLHKNCNRFRILIEAQNRGTCWLCKTMQNIRIKGNQVEKPFKNIQETLEYSNEDK